MHCPSYLNFPWVCSTLLNRAFKAFWYKLLLPTIVSKGLKKIMNYNIYDLTCFFSSSFEEVNCNLSQKPEFLLERNPNGKVPVLEINGKVFIESSIINDLLDDLYPDPPLYPKDHMQRRRIKSSWKNTHPRYSSMLLTKIFVQFVVIFSLSFDMVIQ